MRNLLLDLKFGLRMLSKYPGYSVLSVVAVALGINLVTCQILVINGFLFRPLPVPDEASIMDVSRTWRIAGKEAGGFHPQELEALIAKQTSFEFLGGFYEGTVNLSDGRNPRRLHGAFISWDFLRALGIAPEMGRAFVASDDLRDAVPAVLISHAAWVRDFGSDPGLVGRKTLVNSRPGSVVGVLPEGMHFPLRQDAWVPCHVLQPVGEEESVAVRAFGRLRRGVSAEAAQAELNAIAAVRAVADPKRWEGGHEIQVQHFTQAFVGDDTVHVLWIMLVAVVFVLLIACANVANLLLARSSVRGRELAVRTAVGAPRGRLVRQMLVESLVVCLSGGILGAAATGWTIPLIIEQLAGDLLFWMRIETDRTVVVAVVAVTILCALVAGIVPAFKASRTDVVELLKETARTSTNLHMGMFSRGLIGLQVAMAFSLLILAGLMIRTVMSLQVVDLPYDPAAIHSARFGLFEGGYPSGTERGRFLDALAGALRADPAVAAAAITSRAQFSAGYPVKLGVAGAPGAGETALVESVSAGYFEALGVAVRQGRDFQPDEFGQAPAVTVVNESLARQLFPGGDAIGRQIVVEAVEPLALTVVGVAPDLRMNGVDLDVRSEAGLYLPLDITKDRFFTIIVRDRGAPARILPLVERTVRQLDPNLPIYWTRTYAEAIVESMAKLQFVTVGFLVFGVVAVLLASIGIYGVVSFTVSQRIPEIGIRMALGARATGIVAMIVRQGAAQLVGGLLAGTLLALVLGGLLRRFVVGIGAQDLASFVVVGVLISFIALVSSIMPAQRAVRLTPLAALRHE
jgi:putative ABC transport system permease protein